MRFGTVIGVVSVCLALASVASAQNNECDVPFEAPDVIVGSIYNLNRYGEVGGITAFSIGTESCNIGTCWANWLSGTPNHPVIGQNLFRLKDGRFEQVGQSWLKHGFATLDSHLCGDCIDADGQHLGVNCSDPYGAGLNGQQSNLGPKFEVNADVGSHLHPFSGQGQSGNAIYKRLQVHNADLDPDLNPSALYFAEAQYVTLDDAAALNHLNNNSYRRVNVSENAQGEFNLSLTGATFQQDPAIFAWRANDPQVTINLVGRRFYGGHKVTDLGGGVWHYEYALQNLISRYDARSFSVPIPHGVQITNIGFHDVDYHSGEPYDGTDWAVSIDTVSSPNRIVWSTQSHTDNPDANALRWGTLYNFRFDADVGPGAANATIGPFQPGGIDHAWALEGPERCGDAFCDLDENDTACAIDCADLGTAGEVPNGAETPGTQLVVISESNGDLTLDWDLSCVATDADYEIYEGVVGNYTSHDQKVCSTSGLTSWTLTPASGSRYYLVVPNNGSREGSYGAASDGTPRSQSGTACMVQSIGACQ